MEDQTPSTQTYAALLASIRDRIRTAQVRAGRSLRFAAQVSLCRYHSRAERVLD